MFNVNKMAEMIRTAVEKMATGEKATPTKVITVTGTTALVPDNCYPNRAFFAYGYCEPYFGWLVPALDAAIALLEVNCTRDDAIRLWSNGWTRAFLVELYERNDERWENVDGDLELYDKLGFNVRTRKGFVDWILSGEIYGYSLPGHRAILETKEALLLRNRKRKDEVIV